LEQEADLEVALVCFSPITASLQLKMMVPFQADYIADVALHQPIVATSSTAVGHHIAVSCG
jgi:hypothetical protein